MIKKTKKTLVKYKRVIITGFLVALQLAWVSFFYFSAFANDMHLTSFVKIISLFFILYILNKNDPPAFKLPWCLLIIMMPFFGILLYYCFGNGNPTRKMRKKISNSKFTLPEEYHDHVTRESEGAIQSIGEKSGCQTHRYLTGCSQPAFRNEGIEYFPSGEDMFRDLIPRLKGAEKFIFIEFFIIEESQMWSEMLDILLEKAKLGVDIRIIYDDFGTMASVPVNYPKKLERLHPNIKCIKFNPVLAFSYFSANCRDHRKIIVIDGKCAYTGGVNIADRYINLTSPYGYWKDSGIRIDGAATDSFTLMFCQMWNAFHENKVDAVPLVGNHSHRGGLEGVVHPYCDMPHDGDNVTENVLIDMITHAKRRIYIFAPYLIIDHELRTLLCNAAKRGVDVKIITPGIPDKKIVHRLSRANYRHLISSGIGIYKYTPGFIHSKIYLADEDTALVTTANMDYRSLYLLYECGVYLNGTPEIRDIERDILNTLEVSKKVDSEELNRGGLIIKLFDSVLRAFETLF